VTITLLWRTDVHLSDLTPRSRKDNWTDTVIGKLAHIGELARDLKASAVLDGGDFFDLKSPSRNSHALVRRALEVHRAYPCPVYANVGNHDCVYGDYSFLPQQPLGVMYESGAFRRCYDEHEAALSEGGTTVRVVGVPYHGTGYDLDRFRRIKKGDEDYLVVIAHVLASPTGGTLFDSEDVIKYADLDGFDGDVFCFGHWHKDQGIVKTPGGKTVVNIGSLTRGSLSQDDLARVPSVARLDFSPEGVEATKIPVRHSPASEVFDVATRDQIELRASMIEEFVDHLQTVLSPASQTSLRDAVQNLSGVPDEVKEQAVLYIERAGGR
jgi:DNA repair exonuclease SbcCD nuclease subunit